MASEYAKRLAETTWVNGCRGGSIEQSEWPMREGIAFLIDTIIANVKLRCVEEVSNVDTRTHMGPDYRDHSGKEVLANAVKKIRMIEF
jgi:hypothetical protein